MSVFATGRRKKTTALFWFLLDSFISIVRAPRTEQHTIWLTSIWFAWAHQNRITVFSCALRKAKDSSLIFDSALSEVCFIGKQWMLQNEIKSIDFEVIYCIRQKIYLSNTRRSLQALQLYKTFSFAKGKRLTAPYLAAPVFTSSWDLGPANGLFLIPISAFLAYRQWPMEIRLVWWIKSFFVRE